MWLSFLLVACAGVSDTDSAAACDTAVPTVTWDDDIYGFFSTYCNACHAASSTDRFGAPVDVTFDTPAQVLARAERVRERTLVAQTMPVGGGVPPEDLALLAVWLECPR